MQTNFYKTLTRFKIICYVTIMYVYKQEKVIYATDMKIMYSYNCKKTTVHTYTYICVAHLSKRNDICLFIVFLGIIQYNSFHVINSFSIDNISIFQFSRSKQVMRGQIMVMRGHMVKRRKKMLSQMISLGAQLSFDIHHA